MRIISWNVNGIRAAIKKGFVEWLQTANADIVCLQETKALPGQVPPDALNPKGYHTYWATAVKKGYSGTAIYTKEEPLEVTNLGADEFDNEGRVQIAQYNSFALINTYFPNSQEGGKRIDYKLDFCDAILKKCRKLVKGGTDVVLCGDYNIAHTPIDLKNPKNNEKNPGYLPEEREWMTKFLNAGYIDTFRSLHPDEPGHYTWWSYRFHAREKDIGWRIDYHSVNESAQKRVKGADILKDIMGSDHCPITLEWDA